MCSKYPNPSFNRMRKRIARHGGQLWHGIGYSNRWSTRPQARKHRRRSGFYPPTPSGRSSSFPEWGTLRIFSKRERYWVSFERFQRLLKISASKAAGNGMTEAYPCGTSQGGTRTRTQPGKGRVLARWGWAGENVGIFSSRLQFADGAL
jgi:hypothetical protein